MISFGFGKENAEMISAPFLISAEDGEENTFRLVIALAAEGEKETDIDDMGIAGLAQLLADSMPIYPDESERYEIVFEDYVLHMTRNESYTSWDDYEVRRGRYLVEFDRSRLLDCLPELIVDDLIEPYSRFPDKRCRHYGVYCEDHIIDVIAAGEPVVRKLPRTVMPVGE